MIYEKLFYSVYTYKWNIVSRCVHSTQEFKTMVKQ